VKSEKGEIKRKKIASPSGGGVDRREFLGLGAGAAGLFCSITPSDIPNLRKRDVAKIDAAASGLTHPKGLRRKAKAAGKPVGWDPVDGYSTDDDQSVTEANRVFKTAEPAEGGQVREYWIQATSAPWNPVPTGRDTWMGMAHRMRPFRAFMYQEMESGFSGPKTYEDGSVAKPQMPGPALEAEVGDVLEVHFRNADEQFLQAVTMHPHGVRYTPDYDGIFLNEFTRVGGFVAPGEEFTYRWECLPSSVGAWPYHDHGPNHVLNSSRGLFGSIVIREKGETPPDREYFLHIHSLAPAITRSPQMLHTINGRAFAGNTPTLRAKVGETVAIHVFGTNNDFHTFHIHGHRWLDAGRHVDSPTIGPSESFTIKFQEDNPGRWLYHCHVASHMDAGMAGWYLVEA
jgi:FtsP/CotA-like multicopper oxidase with cupredoxin domain